MAVRGDLDRAQALTPQATPRGARDGRARRARFNPRDGRPFPSKRPDFKPDLTDPNSVRMTAFGPRNACKPGDLSIAGALGRIPHFATDSGRLGIQRGCMPNGSLPRTTRQAGCERRPGAALGDLRTDRKQSSADIRVRAEHRRGEAAQLPTSTGGPAAGAGGGGARARGPSRLLGLAVAIQGATALAAGLGIAAASLVVCGRMWARLGRRSGVGA
jgi:hypothetical protein